MTTWQDPFTAPPSPELPLPNAPLVRVITRINFPAIVSIAKSEFIASFQEALRAKYPVLRPEQTVVFASPTARSPSAQIAWRFSDAKGAWRVSLAPDFLAMETSAYVSRANFIERLSEPLRALDEHIKPQVMDRVGLRYIDRITGEAVNRLPTLVRPEVIGMLATDAVGYVQHAVCESLFSLPPDKTMLHARWGRLPKGGTIDPAAIEPIDQPSWILDLDMYRSESRSFSTDSVLEEVRSFSERIYTFFRWAVTDDFLRLYGGQI